MIMEIQQPAMGYAREQQGRTIEADSNSTLPKINKISGFRGWAWWLTPVILVTCQAEIGRIEVQGQLQQIVSETPSQT
jgi:hypothetical protein